MVLVDSHHKILWSGEGVYLHINTFLRMELLKFLDAVVYYRNSHVCEVYCRYSRLERKLKMYKQYHRRATIFGE